MVAYSQLEQSIDPVGLQRVLRDVIALLDISVVGAGLQLAGEPYAVAIGPSPSIPCNPFRKRLPEPVVILGVTANRAGSPSIASFCVSAGRKPNSEFGRDFDRCQSRGR